MANQATLRQKAERAERKIRLLAALIGIVLTVTAGWLSLNRLGGSLRSLSYDIPFLYPKHNVADDVRIVYLGELDGKAVDRRTQAALLDKIGEAGARAVVYDLLFDRPSEDPETDREFAAAMLRFRGVDENREPVPGARQRSIFLASGRKSFEQTGVIVEQLIPPTDELLAAADDFGLVALVHDDSYTVRELTTGTADEPSVTWKAAAALGAKLEESERLSPKWINYAGPPRRPGDLRSRPAINSLGADEVLQGATPMLRDKVVVIGARPEIVGAEAGLDLFSTPYKRFDRRGDLPLMSGVEVQTNILINLMRGNWLTRSGAKFDLWMVVIAGCIAGFGFTRLRPLYGVLAAVAGVVLLITAGIVSMQQAHFWFPWSVAAFLQIPVALGWGTGSRFYIEKFFREKLSKEQQFLKDAFEKYLSPQMLDRLTEDGFQMKFGGEKVEAAMMFTDLESFTNMCERVGDPEKIVEALSDYFERTTGHIFDHEGVVIKFIGDAIFAAWGAPILDPLAPVKAARAAWYLSQDDNLVVQGVSMKTRIGVHYGEVVAGNIGSRKRVDYTMIGDAVNLAARLEGLNKMFGTQILISEDVESHFAGEFVTRKLGRFRVKGRKEPTAVFELLGPVLDVDEPEWLPVYNRAVTALEVGDLEAAHNFFEETDGMRGDAGDGPSKFFLKVLAGGDALKGGVYDMTEK